MVVGYRMVCLAGFAVFADGALQSLVFAQREGSTSTTSIGPLVSLRQALGLSKEW